MVSGCWRSASVAIQQRWHNGSRGTSVHCTDCCPEEVLGRQGHEWLYVLSGRVRIVLGDEDLLLGPGEAAEFSTRTPHWTSGIGGPAEVLMLMGITASGRPCG